ncbi:hypothetical protein LOK49_LG06G02083 [Camellia lanceoleosa]|uniref:Uncharacterized protein n=1 Tax=Camellia lanceoleosa TaxID=1840588 RepID=A0ACC0HDM3_9ERIC|nr:hypothetical protein LOK49_LG06G02083 [Camellia lanceoleosa]
MKMTAATMGKRRSMYNGGGPSGPKPIPMGRKMRQTTTASINVTCSTPHPCCSPLLLILQKLVWISKTNVQLSDNGFVICIGQASLDQFLFLQNSTAPPLLIIIISLLPPLKRKINKEQKPNSASTPTLARYICLGLK